MMSPVSGRFGPNMMMSNPVQGPTAAAGVGGAGGAEGLSQVLSQLEQVIKELMSTLQGMQGGAGAQGGASPVGAAGAADSYSAGGAAPAPAGMPSLSGMNTGNPSELLAGLDIQDPQLRAAMEQIATHPDGARLIAAAKAQGLTTIAANPGLNPDGGGGTEGLHLPGQGRIEIANPSGANLIHTLAHELGHAATNQDGNSQLEESTVDALGERIHRDLTGQASSFDLDEGSYSDLALQNDVVNSLRSIGIRI